MPTIDSIHNTQLSMKKEIEYLKNKLNSLENNLSLYVSNSEMEERLNQITTIMNDYNNVLGSIEEKLGKIILPEDTRYYLETSEITNFRDNFRKLRLMMSDLEKSRTSMIRLMSRYNLTNSNL